MKNNLLYSFICVFFTAATLAQNAIDITAIFDVEKKEIKISQTITYQNTTNKVLDTVYLTDWNHSFSSKKTPLGKRFEEEFKNGFIFSKKEDFGHTSIHSITQNNNSLTYSRLPKNQDIIALKLNEPLPPNGSYKIHLQYTLKVPNDKFTRYGYTNQNDLKLRYWYITPAVFDGDWQWISNKDLNDGFVPNSTISIKADYPSNYTLISELNTLKSNIENTRKITYLEGKNRVNDKFFLIKENDFKTVDVTNFEVVYNLDEEKLEAIEVEIATKKITGFLKDKLGNYPHNKLLLTKIDYKNNQIYGLNSLPSFLRPFSNTFLFEIKVLKTALNNYLENTLFINQRKDQWLFDGLSIYFFMKYVEEYYPNSKLLGKLAKIWGIRSYHVSKLDFNEVLHFMSQNMARSGRDQSLSTPKDSLIKFNVNISNKYKAGLGLNYLNEYVGNDSINNALTNFIKTNQLQRVTPSDFKKSIQKTTKNTDWFFNEFVDTNTKIDYKLKTIRKTEDSIYATIKNKRNNTMPISLFTLNKDSVLSKTWVNGFKGEKEIAIANNNATRLALNYDSKIPEINEGNNWKKFNGFLFKNKPLQFRFFQDFENPSRNQIFYIPEFFYNFYDGITPGLKFYNQTPLKRNLNYRISPKYGLKSKELVGSASLSYRHLRENKRNYYIKYGVYAGGYNYAEGLLYKSVRPYLDFAFRNKNDYRDNKRSLLVFRHIFIDREIDPTGEIKIEGQPKYSVFNARFTKSDPNLNSLYFWSNDFQLASNFSKISSTLELRTLTDKNRQYNLRLFAGAFLFNKTYKESNFYSFSLDRPTDYMFDYDYIGRSEETGLLSQQIIIAEGGFKSKLPMPFANSWMATANASTTIWKYIQGYFDFGFVGNRKSANFVYDSGIRLNLVSDYFELYFPVYSNLGWETSHPRYHEKIRFVVVLSPQTLTGLFKRRWY